MESDTKSRNPWSMDDDNPEKNEWHCATCGKLLKYATHYCFEHRNLLLTKDEMKREAEKVKLENGTLEPEEGTDYYVQEEYEIYVEAAGRIVMFTDDPHEKYNHWKSSDVEWDDLDVSHVERTGRKRLMGWDNQPFDITAWLKAKKLKDKPKTNVEKSKWTQKNLNDYAIAPPKVAEGCKNDTLEG